MNHNSLAASLSPEVLAFLAASYGKPADQVVSHIVTRSENPTTKSPKVSKLAAVKAAKASKVVNDATPSTNDTKGTLLITIDLPPVGTHDARSFLIAMRRSVSREESMKAIAGYVGYDRHAEHGTQDLAARMQAQRALRGCVAGTTPVHSVRPTLKGYVAGSNDPVAKKLADLNGRYTLAAETMCEYQRQAQEAADRGSEVDAHYYSQLALVERGRLEQIRRDLSL